MEIIAHRGAWIGDEAQGIPAFEKNSIEAFHCATESGFGIETDFRDVAGNIVISHNPPNGDEITAETFFSITKPGQIVAVNVKADGLSVDLKAIWQKVAPETRPFAFDMSVPDTLGYVKAQYPYLERQSEYERSIVWPGAAGFWLDGFHSIWYTERDLEVLLITGKPLCLVSPELHGRDYLPVWEMLKSLIAKHSEYAKDIWLCTDEPFKATRYFQEFV